MRTTTSQVKPSRFSISASTAGASFAGASVVVPTALPELSSVLHVGDAEVGEQRGEVGHRDALRATDVDAAQEDDDTERGCHGERVATPDTRRQSIRCSEIRRQCVEDRYRRRMIRFLIRLVIWFLAALVGIIAADMFLSGFSVSGWTSYVVVAAIYAVIQSLIAPMMNQYTERNARMFSGGVGIFATLVALVVTNLISGALTISGLGTWILAAIIVWVFGALAAFLLPFLLVKKVVNERRD